MSPERRSGPTPKGRTACDEVPATVADRIADTTDTCHDHSVRRLAYAVVYRTPLSTFVHVLLSGQSAESRERKARRRGWSVQVVPVHLVPIDPGQSLDPRALPEPDEAVQPRRRRRRPDALTAAEAEALEPIAVADLGAVGT